MKVCILTFIFERHVLFTFSTVDLAHLITFFKTRFTKILSQQLTHDISYKSTCDLYLGITVLDTVNQYRSQTVLIIFV